MCFLLSKFLVINYIVPLVIKPVASKKVTNVTGSSTLNNNRESMHHLTPEKMPDPKQQVASLLCNDETRTDASATAYISIIVQSMMEKKHSLSAYQEIWKRTPGYDHHKKER
jgi:hypothetical protein